MKNVVSVAKARTRFASFLRQVEAGDTIAICRRDEAIAYLVPRARWEAVLETMELLANPALVRALRDYRAGRTKFKDVSCLDEDEG